MVDPFAPFSQDGFRFGEAPPPPPGAPESANWTALRRMTRGGQGEVWQVRHVLTGRYGTLKLAPTDREERLRRESQALESVNHPNVARFLEVGMTRDHRRYLVYEFVEGPDLSEALRRDGPFAPEAVRASLCAVLDGLSALHAKGLIHRDVKPANIVMSPMRGPVLVDFGAIGRLNDYGLAGYEDGRTTKRMATTQIGQIAGSPRYMSPEQATGAPQTPMTDIWGVGLVAGEMLTGRPMVRGHALNDALIQVMRAEFDFGDIHSAFRPFLEACLQIEAPDRPQTAYDAIALLPKGPVPGAAAPRPIEPDPARAPAPIPQDWGLDDLLSADFKVREPERGDPFADVPDRAPPTQPLPPRRPPEAKPIDRAESPKPAESPARGPASRPPPAAIPDTWPDPAPETVIRPLPRNAPSLSAPAERRARVSSMPVLLLVVLLAMAVGAAGVVGSLWYAGAFDVYPPTVKPPPGGIPTPPSPGPGAGPLFAPEHLQAVGMLILGGALGLFGFFATRWFRGHSEEARREIRFAATAAVNAPDAHDKLSETLMHEIEEYQALARSVGDRILTLTMIKVAKEWLEAGGGEEGHRALATFIELHDKVSARLRPWWLDYDRAIGRAISTVSLAGSAVAVISGVQGLL